MESFDEIKKILKAFPIIKQILSIRELQKRTLYLEKKIKFLTEQMLDFRLEKKVDKGEKVIVLFLCFRPSLWESEKTIYEALKKNEMFEVKIIAIPKYNIRDHEKIDDEMAYDFFKIENAINGYDKQKKEFVDIKKFKPDYVFYQQPYNILYPESYRSYEVSKYAKICYLCYMSFWSDYLNKNMIRDFYPIDFFKDISFYFSQHEEEHEYVQKEILPHLPQLKVKLTGYPKYDDMEKYKGKESNVWNYKNHEGHFRILWTPRWSTRENNCFFFKYKEHLVNTCKKDSIYDIVFRPHPQMWYELESTGELKEKERKEWEKKIKSIENFGIDKEGGFLDTFYSSDCLVSDTSSMMIQYFLTGKPIIYCNNPASDHSFSKDGILSKGFYWVTSWNGLIEKMEMLKRGEDPLKEIRLKIIKEYFYIPDIQAGEKIAAILKADVLK